MPSGLSQYRGTDDYFRIADAVHRALAPQSHPFLARPNPPSPYHRTRACGRYIAKMPDTAIGKADIRIRTEERGGTFQCAGRQEVVGVKLDNEVTLYREEAFVEGGDVPLVPRNELSAGAGLLVVVLELYG